MKSRAVLLLVLVAWFWPYFSQGRVPLNTDYLLARFGPWNAYTDRPEWRNHALDDPILSYFPLKAEAGKQSLPLWNPGLMCGTPLFEDQVSMPLAPTMLFYAVLDDADAWTWMLLANFLIAGFGMLALLECLEVEETSALLGSGAYMLCTCLTQNAEWPAYTAAYAWLPVALLAVEKLALQPSRRYVGVGTLALFFMVSSGLSQLALYGWVLCGFLALWRLRQKPSRSLALHYLAVGVLAVLMSLVIIVPTAALTVATGRSGSRYSQPRPLSLLTYIWRDCFGSAALGNYRGPFLPALAFSAYVGVWTLLLALGVRLDPRRRPYALMALCVPVYALLNGLLAGIPGLFVVDHYRAAGISALGIAALGAWALSDGVMRRKLWLGLTVAFGAVLLALGGAFVVPVSLGILLTAWSFAPPRVFRWGVVVVVLLDLLIGARQWVGFAPRPLVPVTPSIAYLQMSLGDQRFMALNPMRVLPDGHKAISLLPCDVPNVLGLRDVRAYESVYPARQRAMIGPEPDFFGRTDRPDYPVWDLMATRFMVTDAPVAVPGWKLVHNSDLLVYENTEPCFRAFVTEGCAVLPLAELRERLWTPGVVLQEQLLLASEDVGSDRARPGKRFVAATVIRDEPSLVEVVTAADFAGYLVLTDTFYPGWEAFVDGARVDVLPAYSGLRAVPLPAGKHTVQFVYRPGWLPLLGLSGGLLLVCLGLISWGPWGGYSPRRPR